MKSQNTTGFLIHTPRGIMECELSCDRDYGNPGLRYCDYDLTIDVDDLVPGLNATVTLQFTERADTGIVFKSFGPCCLSSLEPVDFFYNGLELQNFKEQMQAFAGFLLTPKLLRDTRLKFLEWDLYRMRHMVQYEKDFLRTRLEQDIARVDAYLTAAKAGEID